MEYEQDRVRKSTSVARKDNSPQSPKVISFKEGKNKIEKDRYQRSLNNIIARARSTDW